MTSPQTPRATTGEDGFTLVEVMTVVLILGILLGVALPTFLGARVRGQDRSAQAALRAVETTAWALYTDRGSFEFGIAELELAEPSLSWVSGPSTGPGEVSVVVSGLGPESEFSATIRSDSGTCFHLLMNPNERTRSIEGGGESCDPLVERTQVAAVDSPTTGSFVFDADGYVGTPNGAGGTGTVTFTFTVVDGGTYRMIASVKAGQGSDDSFFVRTSLDGFATTYLWDTGWYTRQSTVTNRGSGVVELDIPAGTTITVQVIRREDGTFIRDMTLVAV